MSLVSCGNKTTKVADATAAISESVATAATSFDGIEVPKFKDSKVTDYVASYVSWLNEWKEAIASKDQTKLTAIAMKAQDFAKQSETLGKSLASSPEDMKKFNDFMTALSPKLQALMTGH